jgi:hypothetical protein
MSVNEQILINVVVNGQKATSDLKGVANAAGEIETKGTRTAGALGGLTKAASLLGGALVATQAMDYAGQLFAIGDASLKAEKGLTAVAGSAQAAADITEAVKRGSGGLLTAMDAQLQATRLLSLGIASNAAEAGNFVEVASTLGAVIGQDATTSVEQLSLAIANMSYERLDALGISAGEVRARVNELRDAGYATEEAFRLATFEIAAEKMNVLKDAGFEAGTSLDRLKVRAGEAGAVLGEQLAGAVLGVADRLEESEPWFQAVNQRIYDMGEQANVLAGNVVSTADSMGWLTGALYNSNPAFASTYDWAVALTGAADDVATAASNVPPNMAAIEGSSYGAAGGMRAAGNEALFLKDALDRLNNSRTGNAGRTAARGAAYGGPSLGFNDRMGMQDAAIALGYGGSAGGRTQNYDATTEHELDIQARQLAREARERAEALRASMVTSGGGGRSYSSGGGGSRGGGGGGFRGLADDVTAATDALDLFSLSAPDALDQLREAVEGQRRDEGLAKSLTDKLVGEGFSEEEINFVLAEKLGVAMMGAGKTASGDLIDAMTEGLGTSIAQRATDIEAGGARYMEVWLRGARGGVREPEIIAPLVEAVMLELRDYLGAG